MSPALAIVEDNKRREKPGQKSPDIMVGDFERQVLTQTDSKTGRVSVYVYWNKVEEH
jgi:hypothetical protein